MIVERLVRRRPLTSYLRGRRFSYMPADKSIIWDFPKLGWNTNQAKRGQPADTTPDSLNVMPYEPQSGRARGGSRPGSAKKFAGALVAAQPLQYLGQWTIALDPSTTQISGTTLVTTAAGTFAYSDGALNTVSSGAWLVTSAALNGSTYTGNGAQVVSGVFTATASIASLAVYARYGNAIVLGPSFLIDWTYRLNSANAGTGNDAILLRCMFNVNSGALGTGWYELNIRVDSSAPTADLLNSSGTRTGITGGTPALSASLGLHLTASGAFNMRVAVNGTTVGLYINGNLLATWVLTSPVTQSGFALGYGGFSSANTQRPAFDNVAVYVGTALDTYRQTNLIAVCNGSLFVGNLTAMALATGGTAVLSNQAIVQAGYFNNKGYFVDGFSIVQLNLTSGAVEAYAATTGSAPANCTLACTWRGRLVLAAPRDLANAWFMSRINTLTDWDYSQTDGAQAVYHQGSQAFGSVGDAIVAIIPFTDDCLIFLCDHSIYSFQGSPTLGGDIVIMSEQVGGLGPNCWTRDPSGNVWFAGTAGFYQMGRDTPPKCVSNEAVNEFFRSINRAANRVTVRWDRDRWGCWIFITPISTGAAIHLFYDARSGGFWRVQYPNDYGPLCAIVFDGDAATDRLLLMGGRTGFIYNLDETIDHDDGSTAISSYVWLGPFIPADDLHETKTYALQAFLSDRQGTQINNLDWTMVAANDAAGAIAIDATASTAGSSFAALYGRQPSANSARLRGLAFALKCANSTVDRRMSFERMVVPMTAGAGIRT